MRKNHLRRGPAEAAKVQGRAVPPVEGAAELLGRTRGAVRAAFRYRMQHGGSPAVPGTARQVRGLLPGQGKAIPDVGEESPRRTVLAGTIWNRRPRRSRGRCGNWPSRGSVRARPFGRVHPTTASRQAPPKPDISIWQGRGHFLLGTDNYGVAACLGEPVYASVVFMYFGKKRIIAICLLLAAADAAPQTQTTGYEASVERRLEQSGIRATPEALAALREVLKQPVSDGTRSLVPSKAEVEAVEKFALAVVEFAEKSPDGKSQVTSRSVRRAASKLCPLYPIC